MTLTSLHVSTPTEHSAHIPSDSSSKESPNPSPLRRLRLALSHLRMSLSKIHGPFNLSIPSTHVENAVKGRSFIVCIAPAKALRGRKYEKLRSMICKSMQAKIAEVWDANRHWTAPEAYRREAGSDLVNIVLVLNRSCSPDQKKDEPDRGLFS